MISRRKILASSLLLPACATGILTLSTRRADAQWQGLIVRVVVRGIFQLFRGTATRSVARGVASRAPRFLTPSGVAVSSAVAARAAEAAVDSIWLTDGHRNEAVIYPISAADEKIIREIYVWVEDVNTGRIDVGPKRYTVTFNPQTISIVSQFQNLPYTGLKRIGVTAKDDAVKCEPSGNFLAVTSEEARG